MEVVDSVWVEGPEEIHWAEPRNIALAEVLLTDITKTDKVFSFKIHSVNHSEDHSENFSSWIEIMQTWFLLVGQIEILAGLRTNGSSFSFLVDKQLVTYKLNVLIFRIKSLWQHTEKLYFAYRCIFEYSREHFFHFT